MKKNPPQLALLDSFADLFIFIYIYIYIYLYTDKECSISVRELIYIYHGFKTGSDDRIDKKRTVKKALGTLSLRNPNFFLYIYIYISSSSPSSSLCHAACTDISDPPSPLLPCRSSTPAGLHGYILYSHIAAVCMFELVVLLFPGHM